MTYEALDTASNSLAHSLRSLGVKKGDRVAVSLGNCAEYAALTYAIFKLGAILVPLNPAFNAKQVAAALKHLDVELLIIGAVTDLAYKPCRGRSNLPLLETLVPDLKSGRVESQDVPSLRTVVVLDNSPSHPLVSFPLSSLKSLTSYSTLVESAASKFSSSRSVSPDSPLEPTETINIQFTSGTTSHPKAAMLSHTSILNNGALIAARMGLVPDDRIVCPPPLFHCFGCILGYMATATTGAAILFPSPAFDPVANLRMVADHRATGLYGVATMFVTMLELLSGEHAPVPADVVARFPDHLHKGIAAGSSVPESLMRRLYGALGLRDLVICYGMTETSPVSCMTAPSDPFEKRTSSVGRVMPHTLVKVVDPLDRDRVLPVGQRGELAASGYLVMQGYWGDEEKTREVRILEPDNDQGRRELEMNDEPDYGEPAVETNGEVSDMGFEEHRVWVYSGDEASMDADGYIEITGRIKDLIIRGGENIHPLEIENCLFQHPLVAEVSVVGVPDDKYGESVGAFVIPHKGVKTMDVASGKEGEGAKILTKEDVRQWVREHLSSHLVPNHVFWIDEYPKTSSGKIQKFKLRHTAKELLKGSPA